MRRPTTMLPWSACLLVLASCTRCGPVPPEEPLQAREPAPVIAHTRVDEVPIGTAPQGDAPPPVHETPKTPARADDPPEPAAVAAFDRDAWPQWVDADGDCQDTRTEVLVAESDVPVTFTDLRACEVASGSWHCPYTDKTFTDPRKLDVDHLVPLAHAHAAGGSAWDRTRRQAYANALEDPDHLVAVDRSANRSKGARTVETWLPEEPGFRCEYITAWRRIKHDWALAESASERAVIDAALQRCRAKDVPDRPGSRKTFAEPAIATGESAECCRVCKSGQPCGDACISATKTCHKPRGCACAASP